MRNTILILVSLFILTIAIGCKQNNNNKSTDNVSKIESTQDTLNARQNMAADIENKTDSSAFYKTLDTGLKYHMYDYHQNRKYPNPGDVIFISMEYFLNDSLLFTYKDLPDTMKMRMAKPDMTGTIDEALFQMHEGDSAEFILDAHKFYVHTRQLAQLPEFITIGDSLKFNIRMLKIIPAQIWDKMQRERIETKRKLEESEIRRYILDNKLEMDKTKDGIFRQIIHKGNGAIVTNNSQVSLHYEGKFLDNTIFSSTIESQKVFTFNMGHNEVIPGLEYGLIDLPQGSQFKLIVPFDLGYGEEQMGPVLPWSTLVFDIQIIGVR